MLELNYVTGADESASVTLDFMANRPAVAALFKAMQVLCILLCIMFVVMYFNNNIKLEDISALIGAVGWILFYKRINHWIVKKTLQLRKFSDCKCLCKIDDKSIMYQVHTNTPQHVTWKSLKFVLQNNNGYIIPLTGIKNAGKFIWLPKRSLDGNEQSLLDLFAKYKLKIKNI